jgi:uncharacterized protein YaeQ
MFAAAAASAAGDGTAAGIRIRKRRRRCQQKSAAAVDGVSQRIWQTHAALSMRRKQNASAIEYSQM